MIVSCIGQYKRASRQEIDTLILDKLSDVLGTTQKRNKIHNLLHALVRRKIIRNTGSRRFPNYVLVLAKESKN
jgi:ATP-dependent DNA helicase RecG